MRAKITTIFEKYKLLITFNLLNGRIFMGYADGTILNFYIFVVPIPIDMIYY